MFCCCACSCCYVSFFFLVFVFFFFFFQAEDGIRDWSVTGVQTCALPILGGSEPAALGAGTPGAARVPRSMRPMLRLRLTPGALLGLFVLGAAGGLIGDAGHVSSGTTRYISHALPFIWKSQLWFPLLVGGATCAIAELRLALAPPRTEGDLGDGAAA